MPVAALDTDPPADSPPPDSEGLGGLHGPGHMQTLYVACLPVQRMLPPGVCQVSLSSSCSLVGTGRLSERLPAAQPFDKTDLHVCLDVSAASPVGPGHPAYGQCRRDPACQDPQGRFRRGDPEEERSSRGSGSALLTLGVSRAEVGRVVADAARFDVSSRSLLRRPQ